MYQTNLIVIEEKTFKKYMQAPSKSFYLHNVRLEDEYMRNNERFFVFTSYHEQVVGKDKHSYDIYGRTDPDVDLKNHTEYSIQGYFDGLNNFWDDYCDDENDIILNVEFLDSYHVCGKNNEYVYTVFLFKEIPKNTDDLFIEMITKFKKVNQRIGSLENKVEEISDSVDSIASHLGLNNSRYDYDD